MLMMITKTIASEQQDNGLRESHSELLTLVIQIIVSSLIS